MISDVTRRVILAMTVIVIGVIIYLVNSESFILQKKYPTNQIKLGQNQEKTVEKPRLPEISTKKMLEMPELKTPKLEAEKEEIKQLKQEAKTEIPEIGKNLKEKPIVKIGINLPLTGKDEVLGNALRTTIYMATKEIPESTKFKYEVIFEDSNKSSSFINTYGLIDSQKVDVLLSVYEDGGVIAPVAEKNKVLHISCSNEDKVFENAKYSFNHFPSQEKQIEDFISFMNDNNIKIISIVSENSKENIELINKIEKFGKRKGFSVSQVILPKEKKNYKEEISQLEEQKPEAIYLMLPKRISDSFATELNQKKIPARYVAIDMLEQINRNLLEGALFVSLSKGDESFQEKYRKNSVLPIPSCGANMFDAIKMIVFSYEDTKKKTKPDVEDVIDNFESIKKFQSATGEKISVTSDHIINTNLQKGEIFNNRIYYQD